MRPVLSIGVVAVALAVGALLGRATAHEPTRAAAPLDRTQPAVAPAHSALDRAALRAEVRAAVSDLERPAAPADGNAPSECDDAPTTDAEQAPAAEQVAAIEAGHGVVDAAAARGTWTAADRDRLAALLPEMSQDGALEVLSTWGAAINRGDIVPEHPDLLRPEAMF